MRNYKRKPMLANLSTRKRNRDMQKELERKAKAQKRYNQLKDIIDDEVDAVMRASEEGV